MTKGTTALLGRGYTGHEHFAEVGIIHMNGRLYDPLLRRFLNPDPFIQDGTNTQNYNKYAYVLNNPLIYNDLSGYSGHETTDGYVFEGLDAKILFSFFAGGGSFESARESIKSYFSNNGDSSSSFTAGLWASFNSGGVFIAPPTINSNGSLTWTTISGSDRFYGHNTPVDGINNDLASQNTHVVKNYMLNENRNTLYGAVSTPSDDLHTMLDTIGYIPVFGEWADGLNAGFYSLQGRYVDAGLSLGAMVPIVGYGVKPLGKLISKEGNNIALGLGRDLFNFAEKKGFITYRDFSKGIDLSKIEAMMKNSKNSLHFNLTDFSKIQFSKFNPNGIINHGNITNWELHTILNNPEILGRTTFYRIIDGNYKAIPNPF